MINIYKLSRERDTKDLIKIKTYKKVLLKCHNHITNQSVKGKGETHYNVPQFVYGLPLYDYEMCKEYILKRLQRNGFKCIYNSPSVLHISWNHINPNPELENQFQDYIDSNSKNHFFKQLLDSDNKNNTPIDAKSFKEPKVYRDTNDMNNQINSLFT